MPAHARFRLLFLAAVLLAGCETLQTTPGKSPLRPAQMTPGSVAVDIVFVRCPLGDPAVNGKMWEEIDEQHFPAELRQRLARNGFRAGVIGTKVPQALAKLLELNEKPPRGDQIHEAHPADMEANKHPIQRRLQMRVGNRNEIIASSVYEQLPVLLCEGGELRGQTYAEAQAMLAVKAFPLADGRVRFEFTPELHHDQPRRRFVGDQAMMRLETSRPRRVFEELSMSAYLSPGAMVILSSLPDRPGSLGHYFFTEGEDNHVEQKLLVLRLIQTQHDDLVAPPAIPLEE